VLKNGIYRNLQSMRETAFKLRIQFQECPKKLKRVAEATRCHILDGKIGVD
jgi:hypothetical protein